ncbi:sigma-54-dependent Fis family transcriptional regulator [candidate division KSB1 bacterium]|nr:sigma-54-dependent Fis family transcriptional regulator [candidate division KSB1 bacterium]
MPECKILLIDDDRTFRVVTADLLQDEGYQTSSAASVAEARDTLASEVFDLILCDMVMENETGLNLLEYIKEKNIQTPVLMITGYASVDSAVAAMKAGAEDYLTKPYSDDALLLKIERTLSKFRTQIELQRLREQIREKFEFGKLIGRADNMKRVVELLQQVADTDASVLITGETGTGKEMVARALHHNSRRASKAFVGVNCAALSAPLLESELFGHEKGAFTGAIGQKPGRFELAKNGTLFFDEIDSMPMNMQPKLLRVLQERSFERVGGTETLTVDVRVIAAANTELRQAIERGDFREDLYYRLNVIPVRLPPLRERLEDIPVLASHFVHKYAERMGKTVDEISPSSIELLMAQAWPGNVRELENMIERAVILCQSEQIEPKHLLLQSEDKMMHLLADAVSRRLTEEQVAQLYAQMIYAEVGHSKKDACEVLRINYRTLQNRLGLSDKDGEE